MNRKIKLEVRDDRDDHPTIKCEAWTKSEPFAMSQVGLLVHRVRFGWSFRCAKYGPWGKEGHDAVTFWCGNQTCNPVMLYDIPGGRMVCARCEAAVAAKAARGPNGKPGKRAADLVGHSVPLGALVAVKVGTQRVKRS